MGILTGFKHYIVAFSMQLFRLAESFSSLRFSVFAHPAGSRFWATRAYVVAVLSHIAAVVISKLGSLSAVFICTVRSRAFGTVGVRIVRIWFVTALVRRRLNVVVEFLVDDSIVFWGRVWQIIGVL